MTSERRAELRKSKLSAVRELLDALDAAEGERDRLRLSIPPLCPITGYRFFMVIDKDGVPMPIYGGPFNSYTIPDRDWVAKNGQLFRQCFDHDLGGWTEDCEIIDERLVSEQSYLLPLWEAEEERDRLRAENAELRQRAIALAGAIDRLRLGYDLDDTFAKAAVDAWQSFSEGRTEP